MITVFIQTKKAVLIAEQLSQNVYFSMYYLLFLPEDDPLDPKSPNLNFPPTPNVNRLVPEETLPPNE